VSEIAIRVERLSKQYRIGRTQRRHDTLRDELSASIRGLGRSIFKQGQQEDDTIWALKDVSFEVKKGEVVGVIGRNGAGKSTLLKILSQITEPTRGRAEIHGRVGSLLEVGTGFHPELTGRENIYLSGALLGMRRVEISRKFDEIVDFSGVEGFIDTPTKRFSSGMNVRLGFAVAAHLEPENLLIDEILAVGDARFQRKCLGKMNDLAKTGRTILFVSHNMTAVRSLCRKTILLEDGSAVKSGPVDDVIDKYLHNVSRGVTEIEWTNLESAPGNDIVRITSVKVFPVGGPSDGLITINTPFDLAVKIWLSVEERLHLSMHVKSVSGETIFAVPSHQCLLSPGTSEFVCHFPGGLMNDGFYTITIMIIKDARSLFTLDEAVNFEVHEGERKGSWLGKWPGAVRPQLNWDYRYSPD